ncbi:glycosyltransferase family 9 protein [Dyadobacter sp. CY327]|uniref:glycosyltransferase family 9 protein n=1 Tax=Dyadobacter sp. CY327 TaxID=2907301 RepID=UPI001F1B697D|nr:glycosyltransferase family 9 protein [Dyadobacter sp. CY327]MCE7072203.1 glycosyltransferase family 9 protein [Dyadobacter sp. CY327]
MPEQTLENILCIRADNMGDVIMTAPAIRALKETFGSRITLLTSKAGSLIGPYLDCIDDLIVSDLPWVQSAGSSSGALAAGIEELKSRNFDAAIIFTVYSQSALPAAMLVYMADIPVRLAYARENPYQLLTHWLPDPEPYQQISHQVKRDLELVAQLGAVTADDRLLLGIEPLNRASLFRKLSIVTSSLERPYMILHPGVSEAKREYPTEYWIEAGKQIAEKYGLQIFITGSAAEREPAEMISLGIGKPAVSVAGMLSIGEFAAFIGQATCVVSVNTATIHIAAAMQTPQVVLYAETNPQHTPWKSDYRILPFSVPAHLQSRNTVIQYVSKKLYTEHIPYPTPEMILSALETLIPESDIRV